jgi:hypothetical protein
VKTETVTSYKKTEKKMLYANVLYEKTERVQYELKKGKEMLNSMQKKEEKKCFIQNKRKKENC